jgi:hypothetical protein
MGGLKNPPNGGLTHVPQVRDICHAPGGEYFLKDFVLQFKGGSMKPMKRVTLVLLLAISFLLAPIRFATALEVGEKAPDFELESTKGGKLKLSSLKGKNVLINFYVLDFSPT